MKIIEPSVELVNLPFGGTQILKMIEGYARISHASNDRQTDDSWKRFITNVVLERGDWSVVEHICISALIVTDRGISHELVRHRVGSYTQESTRFVNFNKNEEGLRFIMPLDISDAGRTVREAHYSECESRYATLLALGESPQLARGVLPNELATRILVTYNLRSWRHFLLMRTTAESHPEMRRISISLLWHMQNLVPLLYDDIIPGEKQRNNLKKAH